MQGNGIFESLVNMLTQWWFSFTKLFLDTVDKDGNVIHGIWYYLTEPIIYWLPQWFTDLAYYINNFIGDIINVPALQVGDVLWGWANYSIFGLVTGAGFIALILITIIKFIIGFFKN